MRRFPSSRSGGAARRTTHLLLLVTITACGDGPSALSERQSSDDQPSVQLAQVQRHTNEATISIAGSTAANATVEVAGGAALATGNVNAQGQFAVSVPLESNQANNLSVVAISQSGVRSSPVTVTVVHDDIAPEPPNPDVPPYTGENPFPLSGSTEAGVEVIVVSPVETVQTTAAATGAFSVAVRLVPNNANEITLVAQDSAGNQGPSPSPWSFTTTWHRR